jgi:hypothetical protein
MTKIEPEAQPQGGGLLPCPFCGSNQQPAVFGLKDDQWWVECSGYEGLCCKLFLSTTKEEAIRRWNTRADLPRATAADVERERIIAMADALEYELPNFEQMKGVETLRKKLQAEPPRATGETTVEAATIAIKATADVYDYVGPLIGTKIDDTLVRSHIFSIIERHVHGPVLLMPDTETAVAWAEEARSIADALRELSDQFNRIDNGHCTICRRFRLYDTKGNMQPCENLDCLSHRISVILKDYEAPSHETLERLRQRCMAPVRAATRTEGEKSSERNLW